MKSHGMQACRTVFASGWRLPLPACLVLILGLVLPARAETAGSADAFVDSVGINIHLHNRDTPYANFLRVQQALQDLGVRHVRDGLIDTAWQEYYDRHNQLGKLGIKGIFISAPDQSEQLLLDYPRRMKDSFEAYEAPNEWDQKHDAHWAATLAASLERLNHIVKSKSLASRFPLIGPSLTRSDSYAKLRGTCSFDYANLHDYFAGRNPGTPGWGSNGYGSIPWNLSNVKTLCPGKSVITTETGYQTSTNLKHGIPEEVAAKYVPRIFLQQWLSNIRRTYLYELIDLPARRSEADSSFGLLRSDFSPKPAYSALMNLMRLLADPGPAFVPQDFNFRLSGSLSDVHHLLLQKRDGTFYLALWVEEPGYDVDSEKTIPVPLHPVVLQADKDIRMVRHTFDKSGGMQAAALEPGVSHDLEVSDSVTIIEIDDSRPAAPLLYPPVVSRNRKSNDPSTGSRLVGGKAGY